jgi:hypothetical protein
MRYFAAPSFGCENRKLGARWQVVVRYCQRQTTAARVVYAPLAHGDDQVGADVARLVAQGLIRDDERPAGPQSL